MIANLAAEEENQVNIVQEGGLEALFELLSTCTDEMTLRVAAGAIANLAMSEVNQHPIVEEGGLELLVKLSQTAMDSQTQRMIAGAIANLCGNGASGAALLTFRTLRSSTVMGGRGLSSGICFACHRLEECTATCAGSSSAL